MTCFFIFVAAAGDRTDRFMDSLFDEFIKDNDDSESAKLWVKIITEVSDNVEDYL